jgi:HipA-like protein
MIERVSISMNDLLYVIWKCRKDNKIYRIGKLCKDSKFYFEYFTEELKQAKNQGFGGILSFPDENKRYESDNLFVVFSTRLPGKNRQDIKEILREYGLKEYNDFELLKATKGKIMGDNLEIITESYYNRIKNEKCFNSNRDR